MKPSHRVIAVALLGLATPLAAGELQYQSSTGSQVYNLAEPCPANQLDFEIAVILPEEFPQATDGRRNSFQCTVSAGLDGQVVRQGVNAQLGGQFFDLETGNVIGTLNTRTTALNPFGRFSWSAVDIAANHVEYTLQVTDTQSGTVRSYSNPLGRVAPAIQDTAAFATCP